MVKSEKKATTILLKFDGNCGPKPPEVAQSCIVEVGRRKEERRSTDSFEF